MGLRGGMLVACPIPAEHEIDFETIDKTIQTLVECKEKGITGKRVTPFLLDRIKEELTGGRSLEANIRLVINNAEVGGKLQPHL